MFVDFIVDLNKAKVKYNNCESKMDILKNKIEEITQEEPKKAKRLFNEAESKLEKTQYDIIQVNVDINNAIR